MSNALSLIFHTGLQSAFYTDQKYILQGQGILF